MSADPGFCACGHERDKHLFPALTRSADGKVRSVPGPCREIDDTLLRPCGCSRFAEER